MSSALTFCPSCAVFVGMVEALPSLQSCAVFHPSVSTELPVQVLPLANINELWGPHKTHMPVYRNCMWMASCLA